MTASHLINQRHTTMCLDKTPYKMWKEKCLNVKCLKIFVQCCTHVSNQLRMKFDLKSWKLVVVGYCPSGYHLCDSEIKTHLPRVRQYKRGNWTG